MQDLVSQPDSLARCWPCFEALPLAAWVVDIETQEFEAVNAAASTLYGYSEEEFLSMNMAHIRLFDDLTAEAASTARRGTAFPVRRRHRVKSGSVIDVEMAAVPFQRADRQLDLVLVHDIGRKRLEQELRHAQTMQTTGRLARSLAHDFNNLLTVIIGQSLEILERLGPDDPIRERIAQISEAVERAAKLTTQLQAIWPPPPSTD